MKLNPTLKLTFLPLLCVTSAFGAETTVPVYTSWPFDATEAARRQTETAQVTKQPVILKTSLGVKDGPALTWRLIPAGKFTIGSPATEPGHEGDERQRPETISEPFYMMETQLTVALSHLQKFNRISPQCAVGCERSRAVR